MKGGAQVGKVVFAAKVLITAALMFVVLANIELSSLRAAMLRADSGMLVVATVLFALTFVVGGVRWHGINRVFGYRTSLNFCVRVFFVSGFFSQFLVGGGYGGDVYRIWALAKETKHPLKSFVTVFVDRISGLVSAVFAVACLAPVYWLLFPLHAPLLIGISLASALGIAALILLAWVRKCWIGSGTNQVPEKAVWSKLSEVSRNLAEGFLSWPSTLVHLAWSLVALALNMLAIAAIGNAIGLDLDLWTYFSLGPIVFLAKSFPLSFAGWGAREIAMIYFFGFVGVEAENAFAMSMLTGVLVLVASSIGGVLWLRGKELGRSITIPEKGAK